MPPFEVYPNRSPTSRSTPKSPSPEAKQPKGQKKDKTDKEAKRAKKEKKEKKARQRAEAGEPSLRSSGSKRKLLEAVSEAAGPAANDEDVAAEDEACSQESQESPEAEAELGRFSIELKPKLAAEINLE